MNIGFIGCGNMAKAIMKGILSAEIVPADNIYGTNATAEHAQAVHHEFGIHTSTDNKSAVRESDLIFLCVKPYQYQDVIAEIRDEVRPEQLIITIAPGKTLAWLEEQFGKRVKIIRTAPNTPALVGAGLTAYCPNDLVSDEEIAQLETILTSFGTAMPMKESLLDVTSAVGGSSPAYVYMFIEALADAGVAEGLTRPQAYKIASQAVLGSGKMVLEAGKHPGQLKDEVCSPSGSTIKGVEVLEQNAFRGTVMTAMRTAINAARKL